MLAASVCVAAAVAGAVSLDTAFIQVAPTGPSLVGVQRSEGKTRAVVLLHGLHLHPFDAQRAARAEIDLWQQAGSGLVRALARDSDVFSFCYGQNVRVEAVARAPALVEGIAHLRQAGYREIVLVGHSAGGLIARQFVEDRPNTGVTKVVQVCAPNSGCEWSYSPIGVSKVQGAFIRSMSPAWRRQAVESRFQQLVPKAVEFVCVVGKWKVGCSDGLVRCLSQWPEDLQLQGIPALLVAGNHIDIMRTPAAIARIAEICRTPQPRWSAAEVEAARHRILKAPAEEPPGQMP